MKTYIQNIDGKWYAYAADVDRYQVYSIGSDSNDAIANGGSRWVAKWTNKGVQYVANPCPSRTAAYSKARRHGEYSGEIK